MSTHYFQERSKLFNEGSAFFCPDSCERYGCKDTNLHVSVSLVDIISLSLTSGKKVLQLFKEDCKVGFDPLDKEDPWVGRVGLELRKPCPFLAGKACSVYSGRPLACVLFPEYDFWVGKRESLAEKEIFRNYPCIEHPCSVSHKRGEILRGLMEMSVREAFLSDFYLFGVSPFIIDLKNVAGEGLEGLSISEGGEVRLPIERLERLVVQRAKAGGYLDEWERKMEGLDRMGGLTFVETWKPMTEEIALSKALVEPWLAYQFEGSRLIPIRLSK